MLPALPRGTCGVPDVMMISTLSRTNSAAISARRSSRPSAQRYPIATVRPSIQPSSRSRCTKAATHSLAAERVLWPKKPMVGSFADCCARAASGHAAAQRDDLAPPHSITSSAIATSVGGSSRPRAFATLRLMASSNLTGCSTGKSAGLVPCRILCTYAAAR